jgi:hypothetical protein
LDKEKKEEADSSLVFGVERAVDIIVTMAKEWLDGRKERR